VIEGLDRSHEQAVVFHGGTRRQGSDTLTAGGRVLGVTGWGDGLESALEHAYAVVDDIRFPGRQVRRDIGWRALRVAPRGDR
jgi:phosphoribosylamine--glycine ligase